MPSSDRQGIPVGVQQTTTNHEGDRENDRAAYGVCGVSHEDPEEGNHAENVPNPFPMHPTVEDHGLETVTRTAGTVV
jgi:hypothetical protein